MKAVSLPNYILFCLLFLGSVLTGRGQNTPPSGGPLVGCTTPSFGAPTIYSNTFVLPSYITKADFNKDGKLDLAVPNYGTSDLSILLGKGDGNFDEPVVYNTGSPPRGIDTGDFNGDHNLDLAVASYNTDNVSILFGNGAGAFGAPNTYAVGLSPQFVSVADFNKDNQLDLVVVNSASDNISVLLGQGGGSFGSAIYYNVGNFPVAAVVGDYNNDGQLDIAVANEVSRNISILLGDGTGAFSTPSNFAAGESSIYVNKGYFNNDGNLDLVVVNRSDGNISILLGEGDGSFAPAVNYPTGPYPKSVSVADFNGDNKQDLAVALSSAGVSIFLGKGDGSFAAGIGFAPGTKPESITAGDFNSDGKLDLATANSSFFTVAVVLNTCGDITVFCPGNQTLQAGTTCSATLPAEATIAINGTSTPAISIKVDNRELSSSQYTITPGSGSASISISYPFPVGTHSVSINVTGGDKPASCSFTVAVQDTTKPTITAPAKLTANNDAGKCYATINNLGSPTAADNCTYTVSNNAPANKQFPTGTTVVTWRVTDASGNIDSAKQTITVNDTEKPVLICPAAQSFCYSTSGSYNVPQLSANDNCGVQSISYVVKNGGGTVVRSGTGTNATGLFGVGQSTIVWTVRDISNNESTCQTQVSVNQQLTVSIANAQALSKGVNANTVYQGYAPASSLTLTVQASGGSGNYSYKWSTNETTQSIKVSPTAPTVYTVTVTDGSTCTAVASKQVQVVNVRCSNNKVSVCHKNGTLCIDAGSIQDHLNHGDRLGGCTTAALTTTGTASQIQTPEPGLSLSAPVAYPNPSSGQFTLQLSSRKEETAQVFILDSKGGVVLRKTIPLTIGRQQVSLNLPGKTTGIYLIRVITGEGVQTTRVTIQP